MKQNILVAVVCYLSFEAGCASSPLEYPKVLWETIWLPPETYRAVHWDFPGIVKLDPETDPGYEYFGAKEEDYKYIYEGLKPLRTTVLGNSSHYVIEIQAEGDIDLAKRKYGKAMQFQIHVSSGPWPWFEIFTTGNMREAVFLKSINAPIILTLDNEDKVVSALWNTPSEVIGRLRVEIDRDRMRIYLPIDFLPDKTSKWWWRKKLNKKLNKNLPHFSTKVFTRLALPPLYPIPSNIPDVYRMPVVYLMSSSKGSWGVPGQSWIIKRVSDSAEKKNKSGK
ncbi:MAG: hypothetical protein E3J72_14040 [Planctomycetota bacterium]|nr:MAG: hypothetical protein E3J72_14040 [Planctomycetota bacterium]